jgi:carbon storage regulator CsrA
MLVLTRKLQEQIRIGDHITITVLRVKGNTVRVGIEVPRDVRVVRAELPPKQGDNANANQPAESATTSSEAGQRGVSKSDEKSGAGERQTAPHAPGRFAPLANRLPMLVTHAF